MAWARIWRRLTQVNRAQGNHRAKRGKPMIATPDAPHAKIPP